MKAPLKFTLYITSLWALTWISWPHWLSSRFLTKKCQVRNWHSFQIHCRNKKSFLKLLFHLLKFLGYVHGLSSRFAQNVCFRCNLWRKIATSIGNSSWLESNSVKNTLLKFYLEWVSIASLPGYTVLLDCFLIWQGFGYHVWYLFSVKLYSHSGLFRVWKIEKC
jgi:hypothetical protein